MKRLWLLFAFVILAGGASGQDSKGVRPQPPLTVSEVKWDSNFVLPRTVSFNGAYGPNSLTTGILVRKTSVTVTNTGPRTIESIRLAFVFSDPSTGEEWFRFKTRSKKRLPPGESRSITKATLGSPPHAGVAAKRAVITEVKYSDGSVWRQQ